MRKGFWPHIVSLYRCLSSGRLVAYCTASLLRCLSFQELNSDVMSDAQWQAMTNESIAAKKVKKETSWHKEMQSPCTALTVEYSTCSHHPLIPHVAATTHAHLQPTILQQADIICHTFVVVAHRLPCSYVLTCNPHHTLLCTSWMAWLLGVHVGAVVPAGVDFRAHVCG